MTHLTDGSIARFAAHKIGYFIEACKLKKTNYQEPNTNRYRYQLWFPPNIRAEQECLKQLVKDLVFLSPAVQQLECKAQRMLEQLFGILYENYVCATPRRQHLLNQEIESILDKAQSAGHCARLLCDYLSGMSDDYLIRAYRRLFDPEFGSIADLV